MAMSSLLRLSSLKVAPSATATVSRLRFLSHGRLASPQTSASSSRWFSSSTTTTLLSPISSSLTVLSSSSSPPPPPPTSSQQQQDRWRRRRRLFPATEQRRFRTNCSSRRATATILDEQQRQKQQQQDVHAIQTALPLEGGSEHSRNSSSGGGFNYSTSVLWPLRTPEKGTGFDNFIPKGGKNNNNNDEKNDASKEEGLSSGISNPFRSQDQSKNGGDSGGGNSNNNNNNNNPNDLNGLIASTIVLAIIYAFQQDRKNNNSNDGSAGDSNLSGGGVGRPGEITWQDFLRLLQQQDVVKIVVTEERQMARVYIKPSAAGAAATMGRSSGVGGGSSSTTTTNPGLQHQQRSAYEALRRRQAAVRHSTSSVNTETSDDQFFNQEQDRLEGISGGDTMTTMGAVASSSVASNVNGLGLSPSSQQLSNNGNLPIYYRMQIGNVDSFERKLDEAQRAMGRTPAMDVPVQYTADTTAGREFLAAVPGLLLAGVLYLMMRAAASGAGFGGGLGGGGKGGMGGIFQVGKSTHKKVVAEDVNVNFADVAGCEGAKKEIMEFVDFLKDSDRFTQLGAKCPKGALLCGPPGTGKTLLAKAVAGEAGVPFYSISGSDFIEMFVGVGPSRVRDLFSEARASSPCIVFIDEIDAVGRQRGRGGMGGNDERENTLNQLLVEMDGFETSTGVVVLAGTNRVDILDQALTRPGRFDRQIMVDKPDLQGRKDIFKVHLKGIALEGGQSFAANNNDDTETDSADKDEPKKEEKKEGVDNHVLEDFAGRLAGLTPGFAGADIANICNEAAIVAARRKADSVSLDDFEKATDRIIGGLESNKIMSEEERSIVAYHEAGHAVAGWFLEHADPLLKVTIIPRSSGALGFAQYLPKEVFLRTQNQIMDLVSMALAGRAAEDIFFGRVTTGASDDLKRVTQLVYSTVKLYGMNPRLGQLSFPEEQDPNGFPQERAYSEKTAKAMDEECRKIVDDAYQRTLELLREKKTEVEKVAQLLLEKETITHDDMVGIIGARPFQGDPAYEEFVRRKASQPNDDTESEAQTDEREKDFSSPSEESTGSLNPGLA